MNVNTEGQFSL